MLPSAWLNVGSLALGLLAWLLPFIALSLGGRLTHRGAGILSAASLSACALSLCTVILYLERLVDKGDWSALMDTIGAFRLCAVVLLAVALLLNVLSLARRREGGGRVMA